MKPAPKAIGGANTIAFVIIESPNWRTANTEHFVAGDKFTETAGLAICSYPEEPESIYLFHCDQNWQTITDTWHSSVQEAKEQAAFEFNHIEDKWVPIVENAS